MATIPTLIASQPGIRRDGTRLQNLNYTDGRWVRFDDGSPRKMGGIFAMSSALDDISRGLHSASINGITYFHTGGRGSLQMVSINHATGDIVVADRKPPDLADNDDYLWTFDNIYDVIDGSWKIVAHAAPNLDKIDSSIKGPVLIGDLNSTIPLINVQEGIAPDQVDFMVAGGICCIHPFLFAFDNDGKVIWSVSNKPADVTSTFNTGTNIPAGEVRPTGKKIVAGRPLMGLGIPGGLFWSLDTLLRMSYVGGNATWDFDPLASIEIIAPKSIVEYNGAYFWLGAERFLSFAGGAVKDVPNVFNQRWFFKNLTKGQEGKIFAYTIPSAGEIWWCAPMFGSLEPNHAVVLNVNSGIWYDTPLPGMGRSAAISPTSTFPFPVLAELPDAQSGDIRLWQHERGVDEVNGPDVRAMRSYYVTSDITFLRGDKPSDASVEVMEIEPDFVQDGPMTVQIIGNANSRAPSIVGKETRFDAPGDGLPPEKQTIELKGEHRQLRFKFESNTTGGYYEAGATYAAIAATGERKTE